MKRVLIRIACLVFLCCTSFGRDVLDLFPERTGALICWTDTRSDPRPLKIYYLKASLSAKDLEVVAIPGVDPDGAGPAESQLTPPLDLFKKFDLMAAVNANAFADLSGNKTVIPNWVEGLPVDICGMVVSQGKRISPVEKGRTPFWLDTQQKPHIGEPSAGDSVDEAVSDWFSPLLMNSKIVADASDRALHPRTALGFDDSGAWLLLVVVDGRQRGFSEGVTLYELAEILQSQGCTQSINLDGGGSSIMLIREPGSGVRTYNSPSGKSHRPVPVMLGIRKRSQS